VGQIEGKKKPQGLRRAGFQNFINRLWLSPMENLAGVRLIGGDDLLHISFLRESCSKSVLRVFLSARYT
jgi:hypothetical protein